MNILDVGCGYRPRGHVNLDSCVHGRMKCKNIRNFVLGDGLHLPFKDNGFKEVWARAVIEHVENPILFLKECIRVAWAKVVVIAPHCWGVYGKRKGQNVWDTHVNFFRARWFHQVLKNFSYEVRVSFRGFPHVMFPIISLPHIITVHIYLRGKTA